MRRRVLHLLAVTATVAGLSWWGPATQAHHTISLVPCVEPSPTLTPPPSTTAPPDPMAPPTPAPIAEGTDDCVPESGKRVRTVQRLVFTVGASQTRPIERVEATLTAEEEGIPSPGEPLDVWTFPGPPDGPSSQTFTTTWDTRQRTPHNGRYTLTVTADTHGPHVEPEQSDVRVVTRANLIVDNRPAKPAPPRALTTTKSLITLELEPAPEPDVVSYRLYRARTDGPGVKPVWAQFGLVQKGQSTTIRDAVSKNGAYWYRVVVTRRSVRTPDDGIRSAFSDLSAPVEVKGNAEPTLPPSQAGRNPGRPLSELLPETSLSMPPPVQDAPFSAYLPFDLPEGVEDIEGAEPGEDAEDPRGGMLPVAVGSFLVSSALVLGRMPY